MRGIKYIGILVLAMFASGHVAAQTQVKVPVSCSWVMVSSTSGATGATVNLKCAESTGVIAATKVINYRLNQPTTCSISLYSGIYNSGTCESPNLYRQGESLCKNAGTYIASGCANSMTSSTGFGAEVIRLCGAANCVTYQNLGGVNGCYRESPFLNAYCK